LENTFKSFFSRQKKFKKRIPKYLFKDKNKKPEDRKKNMGWEEKNSVIKSS
jgi:hypothetical protein